MHISSNKIPLAIIKLVFFAPTTLGQLGLSELRDVL